MPKNQPPKPFVVLRDRDIGAGALRESVIAIGNFDGVHRGHRAVIDAALQRAKKLGRPAVALTLEPHPRAYFRPRDPLIRLTDETQKLRLLAATGLDGTSPTAAIRRWLRHYNATQAGETAMLRVWVDAALHDPGENLSHGGRRRRQGDRADELGERDGDPRLAAVRDERRQPARAAGRLHRVENRHRPAPFADDTAPTAAAPR